MPSSASSRSFINWDDDDAPRHFLELLEYEVALTVVVVEMFSVFGQSATGIFGGGNVTPIQ